MKPERAEKKGWRKMPVLDTNVVIERICKSEEIRENITEITVLEYPILKYQKFYGRIHFLKRSDLNSALKRR